MDNSETVIGAMFKDVEGCSDVTQAVFELYRQGYCKQQYWMKLAISLQKKLDNLQKD